MRLSARIAVVFCGAALICTNSARGASAEQSAVEFGGSRYVRTEQPVSSVPGRFVFLTAISAESGRCAAFSHHDVDGNVSLNFLREFGAWATPEYDDVDVTPPNGPGIGAACVRRLDRTWIVSSTSGTPMGFAAIVDTSGAVIEPYFDTSVYVETLVGLDARESTVAVLSIGIRESPIDGLYSRFYAASGAPMSAPLTIQEYPQLGGGSRWASVALLNDGAMMALYTEDLGGNDDRPYLQRINPDGSMPPRVPVYDGRVRYVYIRSQNDGTVLVVYARPLTVTVYEFQLRRYDADGQSLGPPVVLGQSFDAVAANRRGLLVACDNGRTTPERFIRLFNAAGEPLSDPFFFIDDPGPAGQGFGETRIPLAVEDDGTIWATWHNYGPPATEARITQLRPFDPGDMNYDRVVDNGDIDAFVLALTAPEVYESLYPGVPYRFIGDMNDDGAFDNGDIDGFVAALLE